MYSKGSLISVATCVIEHCPASLLGSHRWIITALLLVDYTWDDQVNFIQALMVTAIEPHAGRTRPLSHEWELHLAI